MIMVFNSYLHEKLKDFQAKYPYSDAVGLSECP